MKIFIDSADVFEIREALSCGVVDGVTTNPSLIAKVKRPAQEVLKEICALLPGPVSGEVVALDAQGMVEEGRALAQIAKNLVVKVPLTREGLKAVKILGGEGIRTNVTLCFSPSQALLAAKAGAAFVSPFIGRLDDISQVGMDLIRDIKCIFTNYRFKTEIIVASVRNPVHVVDAAKIGADIATIPFAVIEQLIRHPLTDIGIQKFLEDYKKIPK